MTFDLQETARCMTELSVPELGTACMVFLLTEDQTLTRVAAKHLDPQHQDQLAGLRPQLVAGDRSWDSVLSAARSRRPAVLSQLATALLLGGSTSPHVVLNELGLKTSLVVPVLNRARDRAMAVVVFLSDRTRHYGAGQLRLAEDLVGRFSLALEAAAMYRACQGIVEDRQEKLATTVHDLMSPLTYIKGVAGRLRCLEDGIVDVAARTELRTRLEAIDSAANRIASALTALLHSTEPQFDDCPRGTSGLTDLALLTRRAVAEQQLVAQQHSIRLRETPTSLAGAWDEYQLERMLGNLIGNAVKYSPPASIVEINLSCEEDDDAGCCAVLRVSDQGVGIPARDLPFVFEPFRRGSNVGNITGTGLGLASVWHTVRTHHGRLWVDSEEGKGTCITVRLPVKLTSNASAGPATSSARLPHAALR